MGMTKIKQVELVDSVDRLQSTKTWRLVDLPAGDITGSKWVFAVKGDASRLV